MLPAQSSIGGGRVKRFHDYQVSVELTFSLPQAIFSSPAPHVQPSHHATWLDRKKASALIVRAAREAATC